MFDTVGSRLNFPVVAGVEETFRVSFFVGGDGLSVLGATFEAGVYVAHGDERGELVEALPVEHDAREHAVLLTVPELAEGHYLWELRATDAVGKECRLLYGTLTALSSADVVQLADAAEESELRELVVQVAGGYGAPLMLRWQSCSVAASLAASAARAAERAEAAADRAEDAEETVLDKLGAANAFLESFNKALFEAIRVVDNYLWVGGVNTGHYLKGDAGETPFIGPDGFWYVGGRKLGDRPAFGKDGVTPHITPDGFWAFGAEKTTVRAEGRDGLDGTAVRRILVDGYEDIPQSGVTCNGGYLYYVPAGVERAMREVASVRDDAEFSNYTLAGPLVFSESRTWTRRGGSLKRFGLLAGSNFNNGEPSDEVLYAHLWYEVAGVWVYAGRSAEPVAQVVNAVSWWEFSELEVVPGGCRVKVGLCRGADEPSEAQLESIRIQVAAVAAADGSKVGGADFCAVAYWGYEAAELCAYDVYAWLDPDGWVRVDTNYDIATSRVYGLVKLGTDSVVRDGAPVGVDAAGQLAVPRADVALAGTGKLATEAVLSAARKDGAVGMSADGRFMAERARAGVAGVVQPSRDDSMARVLGVGIIPDGTFVDGVDRSGQAGCTRAAADTYGMVRVAFSSSEGMCDDLVWNAPVAMRDDMQEAVVGTTDTWYRGANGVLFVPLMEGGALRWDSVSFSTRHGRRWSTGGRLRLVHSGQFVSGDEGLELNGATVDLLAGVYIAGSMADGRVRAVPSAGTVLGYLNANYYTKREVYSRAESYSRAEVDAIDREIRADVAAVYKTQASARAEHEELSREIAARMRKTASVEEVCVLAESEYRALKVRNPKCIYLVTEE